MKFSDIVDAARALLQRKGRITRRALAREFGLDEAALQDLADELILAERVAADEGGLLLVWTGPAAAAADAVPAAPPAAAPPPAEPGPDGERRQLTVMFCDLVGSTALSEQLDPEDLHRLVTAYQQAALQVMRRYEGHIAQYLGDGILAYFGYPAAHEDDAVRAVRAGLDILAEIGRLPVKPAVQVRVGLHTGPVVIGAVGEGGRAERLALGRTPNIAARVQAAAQPQELTISAATHRLVQGIFDCRDLGPHTLKGIAEPVGLYRVMQPAASASTRFDVVLQQGLKPLQGREAEQQALRRHWQRARDGRGQLLLLGGEAGIGKSRLLQALGQAAADDAALKLALRCSAFHGNSPLYPVIDLLSRLLPAGDDAAAGGERIRRLEQFLGSAGLGDERSLALFASLLSIPLPERLAEPGLGREERRQLTLQALTDWVLRLAARQPVLLVVEDLHWADPSTLALLSLLVERLPPAPLMLALTFRPDFVPPWPDGEHHLRLTLARLAPPEIARMAAEIAGRVLPPDVLELLVQKTDGVPLYVEELIKDLMESHLLREQAGQLRLAGSLLSGAVPFSLQDSLTSRLDRLGPARRLAELAAVLGREFDRRWIEALHEGDAASLEQGLQRLCEAGILVRLEGAATAQYQFRHALLRDAAYHSLLIRRRQQVHARVAQLLETRWTETAHAQPELVAHHYTEAAMVEPAIAQWQRAGLRAVERSANQEAVRHFSTALEILRTLPEGPARDRKELALLLGLGVPLTVTTSWAAPEVRWANERALELCEKLGESAPLFQALYGVWSNRQVQADYRAARPIAERLLEIAERAQDDGLRLQAHRAGGILGLHTGRFADALRHCEAGHALYRPDRHRSHVAQYWLDPGVGCLCYGAWALALMGRPDQALTRVAQALALARDSGHDFSRAYALHFTAVMHQTRREPAATREHAQALLDLAQEKGFPVFRGWGLLLLGCALADDGRAADGAALIRQGHDARSAGARVSRSASLAVLADVCERAGELDTAQASVTEGLDFAAQSDERFYEAELLRLRAALRLRLDESPAAQAAALADLQAALALARAQQALTWELRASTALARLHQQRGEDDAARDVLAAPLARLTEGLRTPDVLDARALYERLDPASARA